MNRVIKLSCILIAGLLFNTALNAQHRIPTPPADSIKRVFTPTISESVQSLGFFNPYKNPPKVDWGINLKQSGEVVHLSNDTDATKRYKALATERKKQYESNSTNSDAHGSRSVTATAPVLLSSFEGNDDSGSSPPDNTMAISDSGYVVSMINSTISYYDEQGNSNFEDVNFFTFLSGVGVNSFLFDPRVIYDPVAERFILVILSGNDSQTSNVVVGFSQSQNPEDGWWFYKISGEMVNGSWFDYPNIGISNHDLFISGNLFNDNDNFVSPALLQIKKEDGFSGGDLDYEIFTNFTSNQNGIGFSMIPASYGFDGGYGPGIFLISTSAGGNNVFRLFEVTDSVNANQVLNMYTLSTSFYNAPGSAAQLNTNIRLDTGDSRAEHAFYADGIIHFVFNTENTQGFSVIRYYRVDPQNMTSEFVTFEESLMDCSYPALAPIGLGDTSKSVIIAYERSGASIYPEIRAFSVNEDMEVSGSTLVTAGVSPIVGNGLSDIFRWGDYAGVSRQHNDTLPSVWFTACYGRNERYGNRIFELGLSSNGQAPSGGFFGTPLVGPAPLTTTYKTGTILNGIDSLRWSFPDGNPSTGVLNEINVLYEDVGNYDAQLILYNEFGTDTITKIDYVSVQDFPIADFTSDITTGIAPLTVQFENISPTNYESATWLFSGGNPAFTTEPMPVIEYLTPGVYNVQLTVSNSLGSDLEVKQGYITVQDSSVTSIESLEQLDGVEVYPNPVQERFNLEFQLEKKSLVNIYIVNVEGKMVKQLLYANVRAGLNEFSFNTNALSSGTYFLIMEDRAHNVLKSEKIVVH